MNLLKISIAAIALSVGTSAALAESYTFKVTNKTDEKIVQLLVSEDGKTYAEFDLGGGIGSGKSATLEWNEGTNDQNCKQFVKAVFSGGDESEPAKFNFCEEDLEIEFED